MTQLEECTSGLKAEVSPTPSHPPPLVRMLALLSGLLKTSPGLRCLLSILENSHETRKHSNLFRSGNGLLWRLLAGVSNNANCKRLLAPKAERGQGGPSE